ncbi:MAG: ATP-binding protein, partial [bacterium]|nr:ATP-binding protein [bacterium]
MDSENRNPFNTGSPARGDGFLGREEIIGGIRAFLGRKDQYNLLVFGQRRIGKTSLLRRLQDEPGLRKTTLPVYINLQDKATVALPRLLYEIACKIIRDLELQLEVRAEDFKNSHAADYFQEEFIPRLVERLPDSKQLLLLFDEFDVLGETGDVEADDAVDAYSGKSFISYTARLMDGIRMANYPIKFIFVVGRNYKDLEPRRIGR